MGYKKHDKMNPGKSLEDCQRSGVHNNLIYNKWLKNMMLHNKDFLSCSDERLITAQNHLTGSKALQRHTQHIMQMESFINHSYFLGTCLDFLGKIAYCKKKDSLENKEIAET
ncbi:hypothetical protein GF345_01345 [Candidatus Woesearchaeota archaeon]|nr:hypothetical protein [Candidatus Woesearchaeota archaeon]